MRSRSTDRGDSRDLAPPEENEAVTRRVILSLSNPKGAAGGISSAHKTNSAERKISLYVKFVGFPVWLGFIGFPHPPLTRPTGPYPSVGFADISPSPKGSRPLPPREG